MDFNFAIARPAAMGHIIGHLPEPKECQKYYW
jgi:hypothetical protein